MWKSRAIERGFSKQLWESASSKSRRRLPILLRISIAAAIFHRPFLFLFWFFFLFVTSFPGGKPDGSCYELATLLHQRLEETFDHDQYGKWNVCSDVVPRGLDYKGYGHFLPVWFSSTETMEKCVNVECRNCCICGIGLGRPKTRHHRARGRQ